MLNKSKYYYFIRSDVRSHMGLYRGWVRIAQKSDIEMKLLVVLSLPYMVKHWKVINTEMKKGSIIILPSFHDYFNSYVVKIFMYFQCLLNTNVVVHFRKQSPKVFKSLIKNNKLKAIVEIEGDVKSEAEYLKTHKYHEGFYDKIIARSQDQEAKMLEDFNYASKILVVTQKLKELYSKRYNVEDRKIGVIPTGADSNVFYVDQEERQRLRMKLNLSNHKVFIFTGNVFYSWQNISKTILFFKTYQKMNSNSFLILLIRKQDHDIAKEFLKKHELKSGTYLLTSVAHDEVNSYLNAADVGILLRHDHLMNNVSSPGKVGEYLSTGLTIITSPGIGEYSEIIKKKKIGVLVNVNESPESMTKSFCEFNQALNRREISQLGHQYFSVQTFEKLYPNFLRSINDL